MGLSPEMEAALKAARDKIAGSLKGDGKIVITVRGQGLKIVSKDPKVVIQPGR